MFLEDETVFRSPAPISAMLCGSSENITIMRLRLWRNMTLSIVFLCAQCTFLDVATF